MHRSLRSFGFALALATTIPAFAAGCAEDSDELGESSEDATANRGRFELFVGVDGNHYFQLLAGNHEKLLRSEGYSSKSSAKKGIESVIKNGKVEARYQILAAQGGEYYFNIVATNGQIVGTSDTYVSKSNAVRGRDTVMRLLDNSTVKELLPEESQFTVFKGSDGQSYFRLRATNGEIILSSEGYSSNSAAKAGIEAVKNVGLDPRAYEVLEAKNGQHYFRLGSTNGQLVGRGEMYATKYNAQRGAETVRQNLRDIVGANAPSDEEVRTAIEAATDGAIYISESDYGFSLVEAPLSGAPAITADLVREMMAAYVDNDDAADKPMASLYSMEGDWSEWITDGSTCDEAEDEWAQDICVARAQLDRALADNLTDVKVFYFGAHGSDGNVNGIGVSIFVVGRTAEGNLMGVRTIAIWT